ncbi:MAG: hypothetical protein NT061_01890 [Spirochaetes bacterium]|nr:hypothetical protein [Spirochaetota bacterium]
MFNRCDKGFPGKKRQDGPKKVYLPLFALLGLTIAFILPLSCSRGYSRYLKLPLGWALVSTAYARLKVSPDLASTDAGALRGGTIFSCRQRRIDPMGSEAGGFWYEYSEGGLSGWVKDRDLVIFASEELAKASLAAVKP